MASRRSKEKSKDVAAAPIARPPLSRGKRIAFRTIAVLLPVLLVAVVEIVLRVCGFGGYPPTFVNAGPTTRGALIITDTPGPASFFFANRSKPGSIDQYAFYAPKPKNTIRIMLVGESAAKGFPQPMAFASSAFLQAMLADAWPDKNVEVINLGTTAIASFPVLQIMTESLAQEPDLVIAYLGNNEFFGAYGVVSLHTAGASPTAIRLQRSVRSLAIAQGLDRLIHPTPAGPPDRTLMEAMMGRSSVATDDPLRAAAARNLRAHVGRMIDRCKSANVPIIVCTPPCNERDLAPLGDNEPAKAHFARAQFLAAEAKHDEAIKEFAAAIDLDTMPWRPPSMLVNAIRDVAKERGATLCDLEKEFRAASPGGAVGWELMDDHVHPTLEGQALIARSIVKALVDAKPSLAVSQTAFAALPSDADYIKKLGDNIYDRFAVAHTVRLLADIPFFKKTNPGFYDRFAKLAADYEAKMQPEAIETTREWTKPAPHAGARRPITGMVARVLIRLQKYDEAEALLKVAQRSVAQYTSWNLEYVYFQLACREKVQGKLTDADFAIAAEAIDRGKFLLARGKSESGMAERYVGRLHQLRGEWELAIPFLAAARPKLRGTDLVAIDDALVISYSRTGRLEQAKAIIANGVANAGEFAPLYRQMAGHLPTK